MVVAIRCYPSSLRRTGPDSYKHPILAIIAQKTHSLLGIQNKSVWADTVLQERIQFSGGRQAVHQARLIRHARLALVREI